MFRIERRSNVPAQNAPVDPDVLEAVYEWPRNSYRKPGSINDSGDSNRYLIHLRSSGSLHRNPVSFQFFLYLVETNYQIAEARHIRDL